MARYLTKVYCRIRYADGSEGPGYSWLCWNGKIFGDGGKATYVEIKEDQAEIKVDGDTFTAIIDFGTLDRLESHDTPRVLRASNANNLKIYDPS